MYCQKCGRKLKNGMRFCDYCGQPVNGGARNTGRTNTSQNRRTNTSVSRTTSTDSAKSRAQYERNKKRRELERKKAQRNRRVAFFVILIAIVAAVIMYFVTNKWMTKELDKNGGLNGNSSNETIETTEEPKQDNLTDKEEETKEKENSEEEEKQKQEEEEKQKQEEEEKQKKEEAEKEPYADVAEDFDVLKDDNMDEVGCVYPKSFTKETKKGNYVVWSGADEGGDGSVIIYSEYKGTSKKADKLLADYENGLGTDNIMDSESDPDSYVITYERNGKVTHRKAVLADGMCIYYDFSYPEGSDNAGNYEEYIEYMDYYLDEELKLFKKNSQNKDKS